MAITDGLLKYSAVQALSGAGSAVSTNLIDHGTDRDIGIGESMAVCITVDVAAGGTAPTFAAALQVATTPGGSYSTIATTATIAAAALVAGARFYIVVPPDATFDRSSQLNYTLGGTAPTISVTANLIPLKFAQADQYGPAAFTVQ